MALWLTKNELMAKPASGAAWDAVKRAAQGTWQQANISDPESTHNTSVLAGAYYATRTSDTAILTKTRQGLNAIIGTEADGRVLQLGRYLAAYMIAADTINYRDAKFVDWVKSLNNKQLSNAPEKGTDSLISRHESRANNWGACCGMSRVAADLYTGDKADLATAVQVWRGWLGNKSKLDRVLLRGCWQELVPRRGEPAARQPEGRHEAGAPDRRLPARRPEQDRLFSLATPMRQLPARCLRVRARPRRDAQKERLRHGYPLVRRSTPPHPRIPRTQQLPRHRRRLLAALPGQSPLPDHPAQERQRTIEGQEHGMDRLDAWLRTTMGIDRSDYYNHARFKEALAALRCPLCEASDTAIFIGPGIGDKFAKIVCSVCEEEPYIAWLPWPAKPAKQKARRGYRLPRNDEDACFFCTITRLEAPFVGRTLEVRHELDRALLIDVDERPDEPDNLSWICSHCKGHETTERTEIAHLRARLAVDAIEIEP